MTCFCFSVSTCNLFFDIFGCIVAWKYLQMSNGYTSRRMAWHQGETERFFWAVSFFRPLVGFLRNGGGWRKNFFIFHFFKKILIFIFDFLFYFNFFKNFRSSWIIIFNFLPLFRSDWKILFFSAHSESEFSEKLNFLSVANFLIFCSEFTCDSISGS